MINKDNQKSPSLFKQIKKYKTSYILMTPYMIFFVLFTITPVVIAICLGFTQYNLLQEPKFVFIDNYIKMFLEDDIFMIAFQNTLFMGLIIGPLSYILCFLIAWMISGLKRGLRSFITAVFYIPTIIGVAGWGIWRLFFSPERYGILNGLLMNAGFIKEPIGWLIDQQHIMPTLIVVQLWMSMGISFLSFVAGMQTIDKSLYEAGVLDGIKNRFQELWYITLPSMVPQLIFGAVMQIIASFSISDVSIELAGFPSTSYAGETMVTHIMDYGTNRYEFGYACAMAVVLVGIMVLLNKVITKLLSKIG